MDEIVLAERQASTLFERYSVDQVKSFARNSRSDLWRRKEDLKDCVREHCKLLLECEDGLCSMFDKSSTLGSSCAGLLSQVSAPPMQLNRAAEEVGPPDADEACGGAVALFLGRAVELAWHFLDSGRLVDAGLLCILAKGVAEGRGFGTFCTVHSAKVPCNAVLGATKHALCRSETVASLAEMSNVVSARMLLTDCAVSTALADFLDCRGAALTREATQHCTLVAQKRRRRQNPALLLDLMNLFVGTIRDCAELFDGECLVAGTVLSSLRNRKVLLEACFGSVSGLPCDALSLIPSEDSWARMFDLSDCEVHKIAKEWLEQAEKDLRRATEAVLGGVYSAGMLVDLFDSLRKGVRESIGDLSAWKSTCQHLFGSDINVQGLISGSFCKAARSLLADRSAADRRTFCAKLDETLHAMRASSPTGRAALLKDDSFADQLWNAPDDFESLKSDELIAQLGSDLHSFFCRNRVKFARTIAADLDRRVEVLVERSKMDDNDLSVVVDEAVFIGRVARVLVSRSSHLGDLLVQESELMRTGIDDTGDEVPASLLLHRVHGKSFMFWTEWLSDRVGRICDESWASVDPEVERERSLSWPRPQLNGDGSAAVAVPIRASPVVSCLVFNVCEEFYRVGAAGADPMILQSCFRLLFEKILTSVETFLDTPQFGAFTREECLQTSFNFGFLCAVFGGRLLGRDDALLLRVTGLKERLYCKVDPIERVLCAPAIDANVRGHTWDSRVMLGLLLGGSEDWEGSQRRGPNDSLPLGDVPPIFPIAAPVTRFSVLPVAAPRLPSLSLELRVLRRGSTRVSQICSIRQT